MLTFDYHPLPVRVIFGLGGAERKLAGVIDDFDARRVLVVATEREEPLARRLVARFSGRVAGVFTDVRPHVPIGVAEAARGAAARCDADMVLSVGGGSTTYAGSELTPVWGLTEHARKTTGTDPRVQPRVVVYDPVLTATLPPALSAVSGLNAMAHCVEAFWGPRANPVSSLMAGEGIRALAAGLPGVVTEPGDLEARSEVLYGAWLAGTVFATAGSGIHHKICHVLGGAYDLPHAETHAVVLPHATALVTASLTDVGRRIAGALGAADDTSAAMELAALARRLDAPTALREIGLGEDRLPEAVRLVAEQLPDRSLADLSVLLSAAWRGEMPDIRLAPTTV